MPLLAIELRRTMVRLCIVMPTSLAVIPLTLSVRFVIPLTPKCPGSEGEDGKPVEVLGVGDLDDGLAQTELGEVALAANPAELELSDRDRRIGEVYCAVRCCRMKAGRREAAGYEYGLLVDRTVDCEQAVGVSDEVAAGGYAEQKVEPAEVGTGEVSLAERENRAVVADSSTVLVVEYELQAGVGSIGREGERPAVD